MNDKNKQSPFLQDENLQSLSLNENGHVDGAELEVDELIASVMQQIDDDADVLSEQESSSMEQTIILPKERQQSSLDETRAFTSIQPENAHMERTRVVRSAADLKESRKGRKDQKEDRLKKMRKKHQLPAAQRALIYVFAVLTAAMLLAVAAWYCALDVLALTKPDREVSVTVSETDSVADVADKLYESGLIEYRWLFRLYCLLANADQKIDPGVYTLNNLFDYHALVNGLMGTAPTRDTMTVMIPEGYESEQIFALLEEKGICQASELAECAANYVFEYDFLAGLDYGKSNRLEGYLFPDTYDFYVNEEPEKVLEKLLNNYTRKVDDELLAQLDTLNSWLREKMQDNGFTEEEIMAGMMDEEKIIIVASLIERETAGAAESATIASVIYNRLCSKVYPCLQIDATIQYALSERKDVLSNEDLSIDSPYNTYVNPGLTPGPIANPGLSSIQAALSPENTDYYFYALDQNGSHHFSSTYYEHRDFLEGLEQ